MAELVLLLLGAPLATLDGNPLRLDTRKALALLAYLALSRQPHRRDALAALLWPEDDEPHARATLRRTLSALSKALGGAYLTIQRETIGLDTSSGLRMDVDEFRTHLAACQMHGHPASEVCAACLEPLAAAVALYRDDFMAGFSLRDSPAFDDWQFFQREDLRREMAGALARLTRCYTRQGRFDDAIATARRWLALDRLHEPAHRALMRLYAWSGHRAAALRQYDECVRALEHELGVEPLEPTTRLYEAIKVNRLPRPPSHSTTESVARLPAPAPAESSPAPSLPVAPVRSQAAAGAYPLVGRAAEWETLVRAYDDIRADGRAVMLEGEAGIGKTRLAEELVAHARRHGATVLPARCYDGEATLAYAPFVALRDALADPACTRRLSALPDRWLGEAARLLPELAALHPGLPAPPPLDSPGAQTNFFEGVRQVILAACRTSRPGILFLDDLQWADGASLDLLTYIARRLPGEPLCLLLTVRSPEVSTHPQVQRLLAEAQRAGIASVITLARLGEGAVRELLMSSTSAAVPAETARRLYQETEGLPFFVVAYLAALADGAVQVEQPDWSVPGGIQDLLRARLSRVGGVSAQVLTAAAVLGRSFDFETVRGVSGRGEEETVTALDEIIAQGLIRESPAPSDALPVYDFTHDKLRALVYDDTNLARRRLLHRRAAEALVAALVLRPGMWGSSSVRLSGQRAFVVPRDGDDSLLGQIAHHYLLAGDETSAAAYYLRAGERARQLYANAEALSHLRLALALGSPDTPALHEDIGDLCTAVGDYAGALHSYESAIAGVASDRDAVARLERKRGGVHARRGELDLAQSRFETALDLLEPSASPGERARITADLSLVAHRQGRLDAAHTLAEQARAFAAAADDPRALALAYNILGVLATTRRQAPASRRHMPQAKGLGRGAASEPGERSGRLGERSGRLGERSGRLGERSGRLAGDHLSGEVDEAIHNLERSLAFADTADDADARAAALNNLALAYAARGDPETALTHAQAALALCAARGDRHHEAALHSTIADLLHELGRPDDAMTHLKAAVTIYAEIGVEAGSVRPAIWKLTEW